MTVNEPSANRIQQSHPHQFPPMSHLFDSPHFPLVRICFVLGCMLSSPSAYTQQPSGEDEQVVSLGSEWKFNTFFGEGSDPHRIQAGPDDIVIDNANDDLVEVVGNWGRKTEGDRDTKLWGDDYRTRFYTDADFVPGESLPAVRFDTTPPRAGLFEHFVYYPFGHHLTTRVRIAHADGTDTHHISQRVRCGQWVSLGVYRLGPGGDHFLEMSAITPGGVAADAVMLRPVSDAQWLASRADIRNAPSPELDDSDWDAIPVPGHWGMRNEYSNYNGKGWYRRSFTLPQTWQRDESRRIRLRFEAVYHLARVFLNGRYVGRHQGGLTPFEFDVTDQVNFDGTNVLAVEADNDFLVGATWNWGGIIRDVSLIQTSDVRVSYQYAHAEPDLDAGTAAIQTKVRATNDSTRQRTVDLQTELYDGDRLLGSGTATITVPAKNDREATINIDLKPADVHLWHFDRPHMYHAKTTLRENGSSQHSRSDRFGIRKVQIKPEGLWLNGEKVRLAGYNRVSDHRYWGSSEPEHVLRHDVRLMKNANANFMRIMHGTQNKRLIELCDENGILLFEEVNVRELTNPELTPPDYPLTRQWLREMIERDVNHPSIIGWSVGNELSNHYTYVAKMIDYVHRELDPHRLVSCVSNTGYRDHETPVNDPLGESDVMLQNCYMQRPTTMIEALHRKWPNKPIFFSEFGMGKFTEASLDGSLPELDQWNACIRGHFPFVIGASLWTYNDYRSGYAQTLEDENRAWGLVNVWRQKRRLFAQCRSENSPVLDIQIDAVNPNQNNASVKIPIRGRDDYPCFTMQDYDLVWQFRDSDGNTLLTESIDLPTLQPGDSPWTGTIHWQTFPTDAFDLVARLVTPNGFTRYETVQRFAVPQKPTGATAIASHDSIRVFFDRPASADEWFVRCSGPDGTTTESKRTIDPYVDLSELTAGGGYQVRVITSNAKGDSVPSQPIDVTTDGTILPPVIWHAFVHDGRLVVGYSAQPDDATYVVQYGEDESDLSSELQTDLRGMLSVDVNDAKSVSLRMKRIASGKESGWSNIVNATEDVFAE
ncbi:Beta-galactosidase [Crateriforma conspicua]|nr:Beta-galactosidase [Crateriforma conspicua]